jgi:formylmethanofuran dehydrogenase subunit E
VYAPEMTGKSRQQLTAYCRMPDSVLFRVQQVRVPIKPVDLPGPTRRKVTCRRCGQVVRDGREMTIETGYVCRPCGGDAYFTSPREITWADMSWAPGEMPELSTPRDQQRHFEESGRRCGEVIALR